MSVLFVDGPGAGKSWERLNRYPLIIRLTYDQKADKWDVLDLPEDELRNTEVVYAYTLVPRSFSQVFACTRSGKGSSYFVSAQYRYADPQPDRNILGHNASFRRWAEEYIKSHPEIIAA